MLRVLEIYQKVASYRSRPALPRTSPSNTGMSSNGCVLVIINEKWRKLSDIHVMGTLVILAFIRELGRGLMVVTYRGAMRSSPHGGSISVCNEFEEVPCEVRELRWGSKKRGGCVVEAGVKIRAGRVGGNYG